MNTQSKDTMREFIETLSENQKHMLVSILRTQNTGLYPEYDNLKYFMFPFVRSIVKTMRVPNCGLASESMATFLALRYKTELFYNEKVFTRVVTNEMVLREEQRRGNL